eukprot:PhF_6_TR38136/c0_g1_i3/m.56957
MSVYTANDLFYDLQQKPALLQLCNFQAQDIPKLWNAFGFHIHRTFCQSPNNNVIITVKDWLSFQGHGVMKFAPTFLKSNGLRARQHRALPPPSPVLNRSASVENTNTRPPTPVKILPSFYRDLAIAVGSSAHHVECMLRHIAAHVGEVMRESVDRKVSIELPPLGVMVCHRGVAEFVWANQDAAETLVVKRSMTPTGGGRPPTPSTAAPLQNNDVSFSSRPPTPGGTVPITTMSLPRPLTPSMNNSGGQLPPVLPPLSIQQQQPPSYAFSPARSITEVQPSNNHNNNQHYSVGSRVGTPSTNRSPDALRSTLSTTSLSLSQPIYANPSTLRAVNQVCVDVVMDMAMSRHAQEVEKMRRDREHDAKNAILQEDMHRKMVRMEKKRKEKAHRHTHEVLERQIKEKVHQKEEEESKNAVVKIDVEEPMLLHERENERERVREEQLKLRKALDQQVQKRKEEALDRNARARKLENEALKKVQDEIETEKVDVRNKLLHMKKVLAAAWEAQIQLEHAKKFNASPTPERGHHSTV